MAHEQDRTVIRGESLTYRLTVVDEDNERVDLTGATVHYRVKQDICSITPVIAKASSTPSQITILTQSGDTLGQADIFLVPGDTSPLNPGKYVYDAWVVLVSGKRYPVIEPAVFNLVRAVTELA